MLSRRKFLVGSGAMVVAGAGGVEVIGRKRILHKLGVTGSPDKRVMRSGWVVERGFLASRAMKRDVRWSIAAPPGGEIAGVIVCLHGRGEDERFAFDDIHLHDVLAAVGARWAVAATSGGPGTYWHRRHDGTDAGALVTDEFIPFVQRRLAVTKVALVGWSMGGYGAILAGERHPHELPIVVAASPALWSRAGDTAPGAFDGRDDFAANDVFAHPEALRRTHLRIDCGLNDPFLAATRAFAQEVPAVVSFTAGYHDAAYWRSIAPTQVQFITAQ